MFVGSLLVLSKWQLARYLLSLSCWGS